MQRTAQSRPRIPGPRLRQEKRNGDDRQAGCRSSEFCQPEAVHGPGLCNAWIWYACTDSGSGRKNSPIFLAKEWDSCGFQVGDPEAEVNRVLVALTPLPKVFEEAEEKGADFLLFHHPLIFDPLKARGHLILSWRASCRAIVTVSQSTRHTRAATQPPQACPSPWQGTRPESPARVLSPRGA